MFHVEQNPSKALIAMSGGVDSSVALHLMLERGYKCIGATMKLFELGSIQSSCCSLSDINDARDVAYRCGVAHYVLNFKDAFKTDVIDRFIRVYEEGGTPNPCIFCNRFLKFNILLIRAQQLEFDFLATGHYARLEKTGGRVLLKKATDEKKDQSYVLYAMTQEQLERVIFPLGDLTKDEVRKIAEGQGFINAKKHDSQDICFVPDGDYGRFIEDYLNKKYDEGDIIDNTGSIIGKHKGFVRYTLGQRRGLGVSSNKALYVSAKSAKENTITLAPEDSLYSKSLIADDINLIALPKIDKSVHLYAKTRYLQKEQSATVEQLDDNSFRVDFDIPQRAITSGQACVLYDGDIVIGGGTIR
jgi:tRNA-specific 2-thiouridylase